MTTRRMRGVLITAMSAAALVVTAACSSTTATTASTASSAATSSSSTAGSGAAGSSSSSGGSSSSSVAGGAELSVLIGSSGEAETAAVQAAADKWGQQTGNKVTVTAAQDLNQQLAQGFASGSAPDLFYVGADAVANYAKAGNLLAYGDELANKADFYPALQQSFTYDGKLQCAPKDMSTLALIINTDLWTAAGLTDADVPTSWEQLKTVATKLKSDTVAGVAVAPEWARYGAFMVQNGAFITAEDGTTLTANDPKNVEALTFIKGMLTDGSMKRPSDLSAGWAGEAFGQGKAAMTIEGNWIVGYLGTDYPNVKFKAVELPAGPTGTKGTLVFTNCWGISATTKNADAAKAFVEFLTSKDQQMAFAKGFGVLPSVQSAKTDYVAEFPANEAFVSGVEYARGVVNLPGISDVMSDFNSQLGTLSSGDPKVILDSVQENLTAALGG